MRICLISPGHLATNPRLVKEADALSQAGHDVTVLAADYLDWARQADRAFESRAWRIAPPVRFGPDAPMDRRLLQIARHRSGRAVFRAGLRSESIFTAACHPAAPDLAAAAAEIDADLYVAHYIAALPAAAMAARKRRARYAFDAEDFHPGEIEPGPRQELDRRMIQAVERSWLPGCAYVTAASPGIADAYAQCYGIPRPTVVLNLFPRALAPDRATVKGSSPLRPSLYWFSQTIGPNRGLEAAVRAIALAKSRPYLFLRGAPAQGFIARLTALAEQEGVADRLHILPTAAPDAMARLAGEFDVGLAAESGHTVNRRIALTNKMFTYLLAGIPTAASDIEAHRAIAEEAVGGVMLYAADNPASLAQAIDSLLATDEHLAKARAAAFGLGQERFNWDVEQHRLLACVDSAFAGARAR